MCRQRLSLLFNEICTCIHTYKQNIVLNNIKNGGARGVMVIVIGNWHGDTSSKPGRDWLHFT